MEVRASSESASRTSATKLGCTGPDAVSSIRPSPMLSHVPLQGHFGLKPLRHAGIHADRQTDEEIYTAAGLANLQACRKCSNITPLCDALPCQIKLYLNALQY